MSEINVIEIGQALLLVVAVFALVVVVWRQAQIIDSVAGLLGDSVPRESIAGVFDEARRLVTEVLVREAVKTPSPADDAIILPYAREHYDVVESEDGRIVLLPKVADSDSGGVG